MQLASETFRFVCLRVMCELIRLGSIMLDEETLWFFVVESLIKLCAYVEISVVGDLLCSSILVRLRNSFGFAVSASDLLDQTRRSTGLQ